MPEKATLARVRKDKKEGRSPSTQAGEFVKEEIEHVRDGKHGARSTKQAIAIGLSKARRAGVNAAPSRSASPATRKKASQDMAASSGSSTGGNARKTAFRKRPATKSARKTATTSATRSRASRSALKREGQGAVSKRALASQGRKAAAKRTVADRSAAAKKAARTKGPAARKAAAEKAARTRARKAS